VRGDRGATDRSSDSQGYNSGLNQESPDFQGAVSRDRDGLQVVWLDYRAEVGEQPLMVIKTISCFVDFFSQIASSSEVHVLHKGYPLVWLWGKFFRSFVFPLAPLNKFTRGLPVTS
jgi:hypothetical protein